MIKFVNFSIKFLLVFFIVSLVFLLSTLWYFSIGLPDYKKLSNYQPPISSRVYSSDGKLIAEYALQKRLFVPFESIPDKVINSFLSAEDKNFFNHPGIDAKGIIRALLKNLKNISQNKRLEGASTITQQVAKNFLLTNEVSMKRKIKEAILAFRIERAYTKERILELYLNQIYLGQGTYGIAAASLEYFDKPIKELNYPEAALLAALPKAPSKYNPYKYPKVGKFRRDLVLKNLNQNGFLDFEKFKELKNQNIKLKKKKKIYLEDAQYYIEDVRKNIIDKLTYEKVYKQGYNINTPINLNLQKIATEALRNGLVSYDQRKGWRGPITNLEYNENWHKNVDKKYKLENSINWKIAIVKEISQFHAKIETLNKLTGLIKYNEISWTKKEFVDLFRVGDLIYVKKVKDNLYSLKQLPKINGGIVVMDPYTGRVLALSGGFRFKSSEFNRATQALRQPRSAF